MKKLSVIILMAIGLHFSANAQISKASLQAAGLTCAMCSKATLEALKTLPFVDKIDTDLNSTTFLLFFKPNVPVNIDQIKQKVDEAGFSVAKLVLTANFDKVSIENDTHINYSGNTFHFINAKNQVLTGDRNITVIDKDFVSAKQFKKFSALTTMPCYQTGVMAGCCKTEGKTTSQRIYHVTI
ncbi:Copper chaperone CopZ [Chitinophaga sp. CF118]|uniref:heavy-metal-associated domain-containing protein n=1 Tax=Chitinophaga sp. CF118 TaxID=1884367 RepID=UPI0008EE3A91|nr:heavy-metal-associated domain-containing protein [Chitinophaga sp. CF118]SFD06096.1 Copper chaperone CopZ [Chitinophaga sp. CF118]